MGKELQPITPSNALEIYQCDKAEEIISRIELEARSIVPDLSTDKGRKAIASAARKVSTPKVALDNLGKDLASDWKTKAKGVDAERKLIRDRLDALRDEIRQPLTDWEDAEKEREQAEREANKKHIGNVRREAKEDLMRIVDEATAKKIVLAISKGEIENVTINY